MAAFTRKASRDVAIAAAILALTFVGSGTLFAQAPNAAPSAARPAALPANGAVSGKGVAAPAGPQIDSKEIAGRLNRELGIDLEATTTGWQHELDQVESAL